MQAAGAQEIVVELASPSMVQLTSLGVGTLTRQNIPGKSAVAHG